MPDSANIFFGDPSMGLSDKAFHLEGYAGPESAIRLLREYAEETHSFREFIGALFMVSGGDDPGLYLDRVESAKHDYIVDYDQNLIRIVLYRVASPAKVEELVRSSTDLYGRLGEVLYDKGARVVMLVVQLLPGKGPLRPAGTAPAGGSRQV